MTTLGFKSRAPPGQGHERMGHEVKFGVKVTPQVKLSFPPGRPPTLDPAPTPAKPQGHRSSWPGQMWNHLTNIFTVHPTVNWVNPQLVRECPPPPLAHYTSPPPHQYMPPPALTHGGGLWHAAPPGNQQQQQMMDPLLMLQGRDTGGGYLSAKMSTNEYYPSTKMGTECVYLSSKMGTSNCFPGTKLGTNGYYPSAVYPSAKTDTNSVYPSTKMGTNGYYPSTKMEADCVYPSAEMGINSYVLVPRTIPESYPGTTTTTTTSKPLNPYAQEWVPPGYYTTTPATPVVLKAPHHQDTTPIIPYSPQDFQNDVIEDTLSAHAFVNIKALDTQNVTQVDPTSASSPQESPGQFTESESPIGYQEEREAEEGPILGPEVREIAEEGAREGELASPGQENVCFGVPASPDCIKIAKPDLPKSGPSSNTSSQSPEEVRLCFKVPASPDCIKIMTTELTQSGSSSNTSSRSPEEVRVCFKVPASPDCIKIAKPDLAKFGLMSNTSSQSPERVRMCVRLPSERTQNAKGVPGDAKQGYDSATRSYITKRVPNSANEVLVSATSSQSARKVPCSATQNQRVLDSEKRPSSSAEHVPDSASGSLSAAVSYARVVERATPSPPPPHSTEDDKYKGVEQPIPKIFQRDRTPPREVPAPIVGTCRMPELFRRPTKDQRTRSRRFLQELKESSGGGENGGDGGGGVDWCSSSFSSSSSSSFSSSSSSSPSSVSSSSSFCDLPQVSNSSCIPSSSSSSSQPLPPSSSSSFPSSSPVPISPLHPPRPPRSTPPMTPNSPGRERSESESSAASLEIDFADDVDCAVVATVSAVPSATAKKPINRFLACILGSGESDSEEEEEEEEDDWDEVCVTDSAGVSANGLPDLDDSWETFGLEMIVLQCRKDPAKEECRSEPGPEVPEIECQTAKTDDQTDSSNLSEINARWEREVSEGVPVKSAARVRFGGTTVHPMVVWSHAYRKARSGPWEQQARDRARFRQRIGTVEAELAPILEASHRTAVYERLFGTTTTTTPTAGS